ncbi:anthranilate synthase component I family protein [Phenylobacterium deserti]|uniref:Aminodeoxychorismate synthase component I n=1 Tax=Phenylobacterium deserti TaxID=1914756 RepID=A0A328A8S0_9CAUL|nr:anthranilate synthase component I family protein [Phenylobacterium deserti]RAK50717.1 aminodeoxychorismate synthase component I [Phenylobacterium deserti]
MNRTILLEAPWREPAAVLSALADRPWTIGFLSGGPGARWSYVASEPEAVLVVEPQDATDAFAALRGLAREGELAEGGPPFQGGVAGLLSYDLADRIEVLDLPRLPGWPDLACARYARLLAFDHETGRVQAIGRGETAAEASSNAAAARAWLDLEPPVLASFSANLSSDNGPAYERAVAEVVERIRAGEIFQANIARRWLGGMESADAPAELLMRLAAASPSPFAAFLRLPEAALVSNSPERFVQVRPVEGRLLAGTEPIKGTAPRGADAEQDRQLADALLASIKDRAENLMIVDLMRNDLARVCEPGTVTTPELFRLASFANVHHLVSRVEGRLSPNRDAIDLLQAAFPPGSITGAPKVQAMKVIRDLEAPRGPFFGSLFHLGVDGALDSSVLIRTAGLLRRQGGWHVEVRAGAGIVADSQPSAERVETEAKVSALARAVKG